MKPNTIAGRNAVAALFERRPNDVQRLFFAETMRETVAPWCALLAKARKPFRMLDTAELAAAAGTAHHGGVAAVARVRLPTIFDHADPPRGRFLLVIDGVGNPFNLGAIARSAAFFGAPAVLIGEGPNHAMPSDAAYRVAEGGFEHLALYRTRDLPRAIATLDPFYRTVADSQSPNAARLPDIPRDRPIALVVGHEERGVSPQIAAACRRQVRIGNFARVQSLNVAQAASVLLHAFLGT